MAQATLEAPKKRKDPVSRAIASYEGSIRRLTLKKERFRREAKRDCQEINKEIEKKKVLLAALKKGRLKP